MTAPRRPAVGAVADTTAKLDALPEFTILVMEPQQMGLGEGTAPYVVQKLWHGRFVSPAFEGAVTAEAVLVRCGPLTVAWSPS